MNKKKLLIFLTFVIFFFISCQTVIRVSSWAPSEAGISGYKTVAVHSTSVNNGRFRNYNSHIAVRYDFSDFTVPDEIVYLNSSYDRTFENRVAQSATSMIEKALDQGVYTICGAKTTDSLVSIAKNSGNTVRSILMNNGIELLVISTIEFMDYDEYITVVKKMKSGVFSGYDYFLNQYASISMNIKVQDVKTLEIIWTKTFTDKTKLNYKTLIGSEGEDGKFKWINRYSYMSAEEIFRNKIDGFYSEVKNLLTPHLVYSDFPLMKNFAKIDYLDVAYKYADSKRYGAALELFLSEWERSNYIVAAYNSIIMYFGMSNYDKALEFADEVYKKTASIEVWHLIQKMQTILKRQQSAYDQMEGKKTGASIVQDVDL